MHQSKNVKTSLTRAGLSIRALSLSLLLMGSMLTFISATAPSSQVFAQGSPKASTHNLTSVRPHAILSSKKALKPQKHSAPQVLKTEKGPQLPKRKLARDLDIPILGLLLGATKTQTTPAPPASATTSSPVTETISVGGVLPATVIALLNSPADLGSFFTLSVVDTTQGLSNVRLNPTAATNANWTITSSTPINAAGLATTTFTYKGTGLAIAGGAFTLENLVVDGDISGCPTLGVLDTAQVFLTFTNPLGATGITPVNLIPSGIPVGFTNPAVLAVPVACASPTVSPTASPTVSPTASPTVSPTASPTVSPTASPTVSPTASPTVSPTASPTVSPTASPTVSPTTSPTVSPTTSPTVSPTTSPTVTGTTIPTATKPELFITNSNTDGNIYNVGQSVTYNLVVSDLPFGLAEGQTITVNDAIPGGITNLVASANSEWSINLTSTTGPALLTATYVGTYPVAPGAVLPTITLTGTLTDQAVPSLTTAATVSSADDPNPALNTSINTIFVSFGAGSPTPTTSVTVVPSETATAVPTTSVTVVPSETATVTPSGTPALAVVKVNLNGDHFKVGDKITYVIVVENLSSGDPVVAPNTISVSDVLPLGLTDIKVDADGSQWSYTSSDSNGPALLTVNYVGSYPVAPGQTLPPITITGKLTNDAVPYVTNTATVDTQGNSTLNNSATDTVFVDVNGNDQCCNSNGCCSDHNNNNNDNSKNNSNDNSKNNNDNSKNNKDSKNHSSHHSQSNGNGDPTSYNGSGDPTSYNGSGSPASSSSGDPTGSGTGSSTLPHLPLTGGAPLAG